MSAKDQTGRIALVTGANRGLGFETCRQLAQCGFHVILTSRDSQQGIEATNALCAVNIIGPGNTVTIEGFTVQGANHVSDCGGFDINGATVVISGTVIRDNSASFSGGGACIGNTVGAGNMKVSLVNSFVISNNVTKGS